MLDEIVPAGALAALEAAADRLSVAATAVKAEGEGCIVDEKVASPSSTSPSAAATVEEFPACVLARASALLRNNTGESDESFFFGRRRCLRALALLAAALRLRRSPKNLRVDPSRGGYESLGQRLGISADLLRPMLEGGDYASAASAASAGPDAASPSSALNFSRGGLPERRLASLVVVLSLLARDGDLSPAAFEALRAEMKASARELASSFREVGARASSVSRNIGKGGKGKGGKVGEEGEGGDDGDDEEEAAASPSLAASPLSSPAGMPHRKYAVKLLVGEKHGTELGACFPALKLGRR